MEEILFYRGVGLIGVSIKREWTVFKSVHSAVP